jgi:DNA polymerase-3 subunit epsilon
MRQIVLDTETTGFKAGQDRIVSVTLLELVNRVPTGQYQSYYVNPQGVKSSEGAFNAHKLTDDFLATQPTFEVIADGLVSFLGDSPLVGHNLNFDQRFMIAELQEVGLSFDTFAKPGTCTLEMARAAKGQGQFGKGNKLDDLVSQFGIKDLRVATGQHGSFVDTLLTAQVYYALRHGTLTRNILDAIARIVKEEFDVDLGKQSESSTGLPATAKADAPGLPAYVRGVSGRDAEVVQRPAAVHHAAPSGSAGSRVTTAGDRSVSGRDLRVTSATDKLRAILAEQK